MSASDEEIGKQDEESARKRNLESQDEKQSEAAAKDSAGQQAEEPKSVQAEDVRKDDEMKPTEGEGAKDQDGDDKRKSTDEDTRIRSFSDDEKRKSVAEGRRKESAGADEKKQSTIKDQEAGAFGEDEKEESKMEDETIKYTDLDEETLLKRAFGEERKKIFTGEDEKTGSLGEDEEKGFVDKVEKKDSSKLVAEKKDSSVLVMEKKESVEKVEKKGSADNVTKKESVDKVEKKGSVDNAENKESVDKVEKKDSSGLVVEQKLKTGSVKEEINVKEKKTESIISMATEETEGEERATPQEVVYEWEQELEEYDEPDIYPSEKDYKWVTEMVEVTDEDTLSIAAPPSEERTEKPVEEKETGQDAEAASKEERREKGSDAGSEMLDVAGQVEAAVVEAEQEQEEEPPKKKYKAVLMRKLIERPPKIHYEPKDERITHQTDDPGAFLAEPFYLWHSFGYDSQRMANLHVLNETTLLYMSGFVLTFFNHITLEKFYLRCLGGSCFGALAIHPSKKLFAAAEKGSSPLIGIWSWPKLQLFRKLREGTNRVYASVNFSPDGKHLASQGGDPDYLITVWNWLAEMPLLRVKSHAQDVFRVTFSKELAGRLTTSGLCHIKFWKMADTFTGLKLKGDIGRFGRTELSDIEGYVEMPDGKVLSGTEWGNLLVWEDGLIVAELCIKHDVPCHDGIVRQVLLNEGEFYTTGQDGMVKTWSFDAVDTAEINTSEESLKVPLKVLAKVTVGDGADIWSIVPDLQDATSTSVFWFAQDGKGTIWKVDLSFLNTAKEPVVISTAHGGAIVACRCAQMYTIFATLGVDGQVRVYDYISRQLLARAIYSASGSCLIWPFMLDKNNTTMIAGFTDGTFRVLLLSGQPKDNLPMALHLEQVRKPHSQKLTTMEIDGDGELFVTGSEDGTIFFFDIAKDFLPMAFVPLPEWRPVRIVTWSKNMADRKTVFVAVDGGIIQEVLAPEWDEIDNETSYFHVDAKLLRRYDFLSIKSQLRHNEELQRERVAEEARQAALEEENRKRIADGIETQSQQDLRLLQEAEEMEKVKIEEKPKVKWEPYIPVEPSPILLMIPCAFHGSEMVLSMGKYDAGYLYMIKFLEAEEDATFAARPQEPISAIAVQDSDDVPITAYAINVEGDTVFWGFEDGRVRVQRLSFPFDMESLGAQWTQGIHDCIRGCVTAIALDKDSVFMITCGNDGNCFLHCLLPLPEVEAYLARVSRPEVPAREARSNIQDILSPTAYTLEVSKTIEKEMALLAAAKRNKAAKREEIVRLRLMYYDIVRRNNELPEHCRLSDIEFTITKDGAVRRATDMQQALQQLSLEMAWERERCTIALSKLQSFYKNHVECNHFVVKAFRCSLAVSSFRLSSFPSFFEVAKDKILNQCTPHGVESSIGDEDVSGATSSIYEHHPKPKRKRGMDKFVYQKLVRLWERKQKKIQRRHVWKEFLATEPKGKELREEDKAIEEATLTIGDMKLKMAPDYKVPDIKKLTEHRARKRLVFLEEMMYQLKSDFNKTLLHQRERKIELIELMKSYRKTILHNQALLPTEEHLPVPEFEDMTPEENPRQMTQCTPEEIKAYKQQLEERSKMAATLVVSQKPKKVEAPVKRKQHGAQLYKKVSSTFKFQQQETVDEDKIKEEGHDLGNFVEFFPCEPSPLEKHISNVRTEAARHNQQYYINKIEEKIFIFNAQIKRLRHRKAKLDYLLKTADQRMVILTQEFMLAQKSEAMEASMEAKIMEANRERKEYATQIKALNKKQELAKKDMDGFAKQKNVLLQEVMQIASKVPGFEKYLIRVFNKKISKPKVKEQGARSTESVASSGSEDDSDSSSDLDMDMDEEDDDGLDIDFPPPELNRDIYDQVVEVRKGRVAIDESELAAREVYDELAGAMNTLRAKTNAADKEFERGRKELEAFTKEKQRFLNDIDIAVSLQLHQIRHTDKDLTDSLLTENTTISRLRQRIPELLKEKKVQRKKVMDVKKTHLQLQREKQRFLKRLEEMNKKCEVEMLRKFGIVSDVETLENFCVDPTIVALQKELQQTEARNARELAELQYKQQGVSDQKMRETNLQTTKFFTMAELIKQIGRMTQIMDEDMKRLPSEYEDVSSQIEAQYLRKLVSEQWEILNSLNLEILNLTRRNKQPLPPIAPRKETTQ